MQRARTRLSFSIMVALSLEAPLFSRRRFLKTSSLAVGVTAVLPKMAGASEPAEQLPPSIAALKSLRQEAKPITLDERSQRQERARQLMRDNLSLIHI